MEKSALQKASQEGVLEKRLNKTFEKRYIIVLKSAWNHHFKKAHLKRHSKKRFKQARFKKRSIKRSKSILQIILTKRFKVRF